ncbi:MAG: DeoR/GlpR transcriptional regulator [Armatimonadetes bacterium]|nr:DeoR/GlpR transcriptional regulator [Armatimonadota bacterium]MDE2205740.1 DeoR/GlpR transcriptional regulator [Armatimonadota bacterium]
MLKHERHSRILRAMELGQSAEVASLAREFGVSEQTVRTDLAELVSLGRVERVHGGARLRVPTAGIEDGWQRRMQAQTRAKAAIAAASARLLQPGQRVLLDAGTTCLAIAAQMAPLTEVKVVTNSLAALELLSRAGLEVTLLAGVYHPQRRAVMGSLTRASIAQVGVDVAFIAPSGVDLKTGLTVADDDAAELKRAMIHAARRVCIVADSTKFGKAGHGIICPIDTGMEIITDAGVGEAERRAFKQRKVILNIAAAAPR